MNGFLAYLKQSVLPEHVAFQTFKRNPFLFLPQQTNSSAPHRVQAFAPRYNLYGSNNCNIYGREFRTEYRSFISVSENNRGHMRSYNLETSSFWISLQHPYASLASPEQKSNKMLLYLMGLVFTMVGCSYAAVPLYRRFCQASGYGGTVQRRESVEEKIVRHAKEGTLTSSDVIVQFNADVADGMPWKFVPTQREVRVKPGESALAFYTAENRSSTPITGVSTYNVTPMKAAVYFNKIQCFCFEEQRLLPGEQIDMPVSSFLLQFLANCCCCSWRLVTQFYFSICRCSFILSPSLKRILEWTVSTT
ncbi:cytochrome c oxidase assembly protein COX11, mitochondrial-like isoform X2 [Olea europaea var. sylvestris]|uniref:cytochrome c oxidase assembly protein COX11, mitochondrial-like isoform X2 n=1 Tax=Olea europaea var. sylvestris TaxID=158386 RepID=UPI000C1D6134|nr:cytochrome c oxidase assembly protein COX11, mitochondrial-like isoform X2 [Olea europaea var. sylvestris]